MKFVSVVTLVGLLATSTSAVDPECTKACLNARETVNSAQACREARRTLPRPKVGETCGKAFNKAYGDVCNTLCDLGYTDAMTFLRSDVHEYCKEPKTWFPKPTLGNACVDGFNGAVEGIAKVMRPILEEAEKSGGFALLNGKLDAEKLAQEEALEAAEIKKAMEAVERQEKADREALLAEKIKAEQDEKAAAEALLAEKVKAEQDEKAAEEAAKVAEAKKIAEAEEAQLKAEAEAKELAELEAQLALEQLKAEAEAAEAAELAEKMAETQGSEM